MKTKKLFVWLVLCLFLMSVVPLGVIAEDTVDDDESDSTDEDSKDTGSTTDSDDTKDKVESDEERKKRALAQINKVQAKKVEKQLRNAKTSVKDARDSLANVRETLEKVRENQRDSFERALEKCAESERPQECKNKLRKRLSQVEELNEENVRKLKELQEKTRKATARLKELKNDEDFKKFDDDGKARKIVAEKLDQARDNFVNAKDRLQKALSKQKEARNSFVDKRNEWREKCRTTDELSDECAEIDAKLKLHAKEYLLETLDGIISELEKIKSNIEGSDSLTDEEVKDSIERIDEKIAQAQELKEKVEAFDENSSQDEIKEIRSELSDFWKSLKHDAKWHSLRVINARLGGSIVKAERMGERLSHVLERMVENGIETEKMEALVEEFDSHVELAKDAYDESQDLLREASSLESEEKGAKVKEAISKMRESHNSLKDAHAVLKEIRELLRELRQLDTLEEVESELE